MKKRFKDFLEKLKDNWQLKLFAFVLALLLWVYLRR